MIGTLILLEKATAVPYSRGMKSLTPSFDQFTAQNPRLTRLWDLEDKLAYQMRFEPCLRRGVRALVLEIAQLKASLSK